MSESLVKFQTISDSALKAEVLVKASQQKVYEAWTKLETFLVWFGPRANGFLQVDAFDCRVGGKFDHTFVFDDGDKFRNTGEYLELNPFDKICFTWQSHSDDGSTTDSLVTVVLQNQDGATLLNLYHEKISSIEIRDQFNGGWNSLLQRLAERLDENS